MDQVFSNLCNMICAEEANALLFCHISPIYKMDYNVVVIESCGKRSLLVGWHNTREFLDFVKAFAPAGCTYTEFISHIALTKQFLSAYREMFYREIKGLPQHIDELITQVIELDFTVPQSSRGGLDGFSLYCWTPNGKKLRIWCHHGDEYYKPVSDLANALLDIARAETEYRFEFAKGRGDSQ